LEHRTLAKLKSTYVDALPTLINPHTQRVHTDFNQTVTSTGRLSSSNPNLQNIPIRTEFSRKIRQAFIPQTDWLLVSADYSQIELRILAHLSQEPVLLEAYLQGEDVHRVTAKLLFEKEDISATERNLGKTINFGVIYGMGAQRFAREANVSPEEGRLFIDRYRQTYAQVFNYLEMTKKKAIAAGFVTTIVGRRRYFEFVSDSLRQLRGCDPNQIDLDSLDINYADSQLLRAAANAPIQGSSADIIKIAMINIAARLKNYQAQLLLQVHDELIFEMPPTEWEILATEIKQVMEQAITLTVPLVVDIHAGKNWMEAK
jgi:DNA polymerase-1